MTPEQRESREERVAIMMYDGGCTEAEAQLFCNHRPDLYGWVDIEEKQERLF